MVLFDAHLDLACLAVNGRDMLVPPESAGGPWQPASVTLSSLAEGGVRVALATIFTEVDGKDAEGYPSGDVEAAHRRGRAQLEVYETWRDAGHVVIDLGALVRRDPHVGEVRGGMGVGEVRPLGLEERLKRFEREARGRSGRGGVRGRGTESGGGHEVLHIGVLMENADPIRSPQELAWWKERGVVAVGLAWAKSSRYATGNAPGPRSDGGADAAFGLTDAGRAMVREMDALGVAHDVSHLSDRAMDELFSLTDRAVMASHSNCRSLLVGEMGPGGANHRQLRDESIREIGRRGGVIGLNLVRSFLPRYAYSREDPRPAIEEAVAHVEHICDVVGHRGAVGLGTDMDGGISADDMPAGIDRPRDVAKILDALRARGWSDAEVEGFASGNWAGFFGRMREIE